MGTNYAHARATCEYFSRRWWESKEGLGIKHIEEPHVHAPTRAPYFALRQAVPASVGKTKSS